VFIFFFSNDIFLETLRGENLVVVQRYTARPILIAQVAIAELEDDDAIVGQVGTSQVPATRVLRVDHVGCHWQKDVGGINHTKRNLSGSVVNVQYPKQFALLAVVLAKQIDEGSTLLSILAQRLWAEQRFSHVVILHLAKRTAK